VLNWKLMAAHDRAEDDETITAEYRESYLQGIDTAHRIVLEMRIDDE